MNEGRCRICKQFGHRDRAHTAASASSLSARGFENPLLIVFLCRRCHRAFDTRQIDLLPHLTNEEQAEAVKILGIEGARRRLAPTAYRDRGIGAVGGY